MKLRIMKMKKTIIVLCCFIIAAMGIVLTGCGNGSDDKKAEKLYVGTWEVKVVEYDGKEYDAKEIIGAFEATFHEDGTCSLLQEDNATDGKWEPAEEGVKITENSGFEYTLPYQDKKLVMEIPVGEVSVIYYFEKKK